MGLDIWCVLFHLPGELRLSKISSCIGKPVMVDEHTLSKPRLSYVSVCPEIEINYAYPSTGLIYCDGAPS